MWFPLPGRLYILRSQGPIPTQPLHEPLILVGQLKGNPGSSTPRKLPHCFDSQILHL